MYQYHWEICSGNCGGCDSEAYREAWDQKPPMTKEKFAVKVEEAKARAKLKRAGQLPNQPPGTIRVVDYGLGDTIKNALDKVGLTQEFAAKWLGCRGCPDRQEKANALGNWASVVTGGKTDGALKWLNKIMGKGEGEIEAIVAKSKEPLPHQPRAATVIEASIPVPPLPPRDGPDLKWAYCITTTAKRLDTHLLKTIASLKAAGFDNEHAGPDGLRIFADDTTHNMANEIEEATGLRVSARFPAVRVYGAWVLALWEMYIREPHADRYAVFQDDIAVCKGLREFLSSVPFPRKAYLNLFTCSRYQGTCPRDARHQQLEGWYNPNYIIKGLGALGLVFDREGVLEVLKAKNMVEKPIIKNQHDTRHWRTVDGAIFTALDQQGYVELVHNPSLIQHTGLTSSIGNASNVVAISFKGEGFDARSLLPSKRLS